MKLTGMTDVAVRILMLMAVNRNDKWTIDRLSEATNTGRPQVAKVVQILNRKGYIKSRRGRLGGLMLAHAPASINIGKLIRTVEDNFALVECFSCNTTKSCPLAGVCRFRGKLKGALDSFMGELDSIFLTQIIENAEEIKTSVGADTDRTLKLSA
ncbi:HTH-type transcriptional repressor NsrR [Pseudovibrio axinellae]|uniref:HTH-type transcriptional repressor NsrR n=1 Tax=Pseudovibrio axinellae TaxID=989403 RepID=A0A165YTZ3_9HYPH|nr:Rrf2 family transcriptional regulator [Pseudovibrio axinellae]KZL19235.1 HTH-type transcriptional repressor NsrR [Pseudovibrio axinellae]SEQ44842.1 transcriptional regulator, BadM/Rrf2 family [Pseudovibrio axinellae]